MKNLKLIFFLTFKDSDTFIVLVENVTLADQNKNMHIM